MKYIEPASLPGKISLFLKRHFLLTISVLFWIAIVYALYTNQPSRNLSVIEVLTARSNINAGSVLTNELIDTQKFVQGYVPVHAIGSNSRESVVGRNATTNLKKGDIITTTNVSDFPDSGAQLISNITGEKKAMSVAARDVHTIPPLLRTGNRISFYEVDAKNNTKSVILTGIEVLNVGFSQDPGHEDEIASFTIVVGDSDVLSISDALAKEHFLQIAVES